MTLIPYSLISYFMRGVAYITQSVFTAIIIYAVILAVLFVSKKRKIFSFIQSIVELLFIVYAITILTITSTVECLLNIVNMSGHGVPNLIPFVNESFELIILNFVLFLPYGVLLPLVFRKKEWSYKKVLFVGFISTFFIEFIQYLGGRHADIDDILMNTAGAVAGYMICHAFLGMKNKKEIKNGIIKITAAVMAVCILFAGISFISKKEDTYVEASFCGVIYSEIESVNLYHNGQSISAEKNGAIVSDLGMNLQSAAYLMGIDTVISADINSLIKDDTDYYIKVIYSTPQTLFFYNNSKATHENVNSLLFDLGEYMLYWKTNGELYDKSTDCMVLNDEMVQHRVDLEHNYDSLRNKVQEAFSKEG